MLYRDGAYEDSGPVCNCELGGGVLEYPSLASSNYHLLAFLTLAPPSRQLLIASLSHLTVSNLFRNKATKLQLEESNSSHDLPKKGSSVFDDFFAKPGKLNRILQLST